MNADMGIKLKKAMERKGVDKNAVAIAFGVKVPSVYDWLEHGRIAKKHLPMLESYFGIPMVWWLGDNLDLPPHQMLVDSLEKSSIAEPTVATGQSQLSDDAMMLAEWFDKLTDKIDREVAYNIAFAEILSLMAKRAAGRVAAHSAPQKRMPLPAATPKKSPA